MQQRKNGIFTLEIDPYYQAVVVILSIFVLCLMYLLLCKTGWLASVSYFPWTISASFALLYAVGSSVLSLGTSDPDRYWGRSIVSYLIVVIGGGLIAYAFSGLSIYEAKSFSWIYIVFSFGYVLFIVLLRAMRKIVEIAEKQDRRLRGEE